MILYVDYDSTLNDMSYSWLRWLNETHDRNYTMEDVTHWKWYNELDVNAFKWFHNGLAFESIRPLPKSQDFFEHINERYDTHILTSSSNTMKKHKDLHIDFFYGKASVIHHTDKWDYANDIAKTCVLIDDRPYNCIKWVEAGGIAFLFNYMGEYKYAHTEFEHVNLFRVTNYDEIKILLKELKDGI